MIVPSRAVDTAWIFSIRGDFMNDNGKPPPVTEICGFDAENILVRGKNLVTELMGNYSFTELLLLQALGKEPSGAQSRIVDAVLVTIMEHGLVPSAIATRLTHHGAPESFQGAVVAGLLGVGDRYAGTAGECGALLEDIVAAPGPERRSRSIETVRSLRQLRRPVPGFGHPIHSEVDPRVGKLLQIARETEVDGEYLSALELLENAVQEVISNSLVMNVSAAIAAVLAEAGVPAPLMRGIVLTARCAGLVGHLFEEMNNPIGHDLWFSAKERIVYQD